MESGVAAEAEVEVAAEVEVGADYPFVHHIIMGGVILQPTSTYKSFYLVDCIATPLSGSYRRLLKVKVKLTNQMTSPLHDLLCKSTFTSWTHLRV